MCHKKLKAEKVVYLALGLSLSVKLLMRFWFGFIDCPSVRLLLETRFSYTSRNNTFLQPRHERRLQIWFNVLQLFVSDETEREEQKKSSRHRVIVAKCFPWHDAQKELNETPNWISETTAILKWITQLEVCNARDDFSLLLCKFINYRKSRAGIESGATLRPKMREERAKVCIMTWVRELVWMECN